MKIKLQDDKYNINIATKKLFANNKEQTNIPFPDWQWLVIKITLKDSKQAIREMFETAFDKEYGKPIYSER